MSDHFKSDAARLRFEVYREGQLAFSSGAPCPYAWNDWRRGTWQKGLRAAKEYHEALVAELDRKLA